MGAVSPTRSLPLTLQAIAGAARNTPNKAEILSRLPKFVNGATYEAHASLSYYAYANSYIGLGCLVATASHRLTDKRGRGRIVIVT
jgi:hypothetical protein